MVTLKDEEALSGSRKVILDLEKHSSLRNSAGEITEVAVSVVTMSL